MTETAILKRLAVKTPQQQLVQVLQEDYHYSPKLSRAILEEAERCLLGTKQGIRPGQQCVILTRRGERHGQEIAQVEKVEVVWTVDGGSEDVRYEEQHGKAGLRQRRIQRLQAEALDQGGVATQEDLARELQVSVRTIKRDFAELKAAGAWMVTRGYDEGIGRGQSHKGQILGRWLSGETYDQLQRHTGHSVSSIQRYIHAFVQVVELHRRGLSSEEMAPLLQMGRGLVGEYVQLYEQHDSPCERGRLEEQRRRLLQPLQGDAGIKKGAL